MRCCGGVIPMTTEVQWQNVRIAAQAIAPLAAEHSVAIVHSNGPQVGLLLQAESYIGAAPYPMDVLDAGTQGMVGDLIQQELRSLLPPQRQVGDHIVPRGGIGPGYDHMPGERDAYLRFLPELSCRCPARCRSR